MASKAGLKVCLIRGRCPHGLLPLGLLQHQVAEATCPSLAPAAAAAAVAAAGLTVGQRISWECDLAQRGWSNGGATAFGSLPEPGAINELGRGGRLLDSLRPDLGVPGREGEGAGRRVSYRD